MGESIGPNSENEEHINMYRSSGGKLYNEAGFWENIVQGWSFVSQYGWFILIGTVLLVYMWYKLQPTFKAWKQKRERREDEQNFDPVKAEHYQDAMMLARERMQQKLNEQTTVYMTKKEEREAEKRDEKIKQWEQFKVISKSKTKPKSNPSRGYFPLSGSIGGGGYRPPRRMVSGGG